ncbi:MAG: histidine phosphatase family protein [Pseudomonadota bacterium]
MATLYLIRHGQASFGQQNYDQLSDVGLEQASIVGRALAQRLEGFDHVVSGTMHRHHQTADNCLMQLNKQADARTEHGGWNEYDHDDILRGLGENFQTPDAINAYLATQENPKQVFEKAFNDSVNRWMSGEYDNYNETWTEFKTRIQAALTESVERARSGVKETAVFTSGGVISVVAQSLLGVPSEKMMQMNWTLMNCGITKVVVTKDRVFIASLNEHVHFESTDMKRFITYK